MKNNNNTVVAVAPNGARITKVNHPNIPLSTEEIAQTAHECMSVGANMIHLHVRNPSDNTHSLSVDLYRETINAINDVCSKHDDELLIQVTSEAVGIYKPEQQFEMIHALKPNAVSIGLREIKSLDEDVIHQHFIQMKQESIDPQIILYNQDDLDIYHDWLLRGVLPGNAYPVLLVIARPNTEGAFQNSFLQKDNIQKIKASSWMICAFGDNEFEAAKLAINLGGHVRVGFENNCLLDDGTEAENNAALIEQIFSYLKTNKRYSADASQTRMIMTPDW